MPLNKSRSGLTAQNEESILRQGAFTVIKIKRGGKLFSRGQETEEIIKSWVVLRKCSGTDGADLCFYGNQKCTEKAMKPIHLTEGKRHHGVAVYRVSGNPSYPHMFSLKLKDKRVNFIASAKSEVFNWLTDITNLIKVNYKIEKVSWEWCDENGVWHAFPEDANITLENHFEKKQFHFSLGDPQLTYQFNLSSLTRMHPRTKKSQKLRRHVILWELPEVVRERSKDLPAIWEWLNWEGEWYPYPRSINMQIEELFNSEGSKWMEVVLDMPTHTTVLLDLHHHRQVNLSTGARWPIRRLEMAKHSLPSASLMHHYEVLEEDSATVETDDEDATPTVQSQTGSPRFQGNRALWSEDFKKLQLDLKKLQFPRDKIIKYSRELGEGQFGKVHLGEAVDIPGLENKEPLQIAVKQLRLSDNPGHHTQQVLDFLREAREMAKFSHPRIVKLLAVCTVDYPLMLLVEFMNEGDLLGVLQDSRPSMPLFLQMRFAKEVAEGMIYLSREMDCVHRDIAARNIMIHKDSEGEQHAKIADFGLSRHVYSGIYAPATVKKARPLPAKWMALESLMDFIFTTKSDVWSFGVLLWEIMTLGRNPYPGVDNRDLLEQIEEKGLRLSKSKTCPDPVFDVVSRCTEHDPKKRPTFEELFALCKQFEKDAIDGKLTHKVISTDRLSSGATSDSGSKHESGCCHCSNGTTTEVSRSESGNNVDSKSGNEENNSGDLRNSLPLAQQLSGSDTSNSRQEVTITVQDGETEELCTLPPLQPNTVSSNQESVLKRTLNSNGTINTPSCSDEKN